MRLLHTNFDEIYITMQRFTYKVKCYKMSTKRRPFSIDRNAFKGVMLITWCSKGLSFTTIFNILECVLVALTHWGRVTHICVVDLTIIGSDNGLSPGRRQAIIWTNAGILLIGPMGTNYSEILIKIHTFSFKKMRLKMSSGKWRPSCLGLNVLNKAFIKYVNILVYVLDLTHWSLGDVVILKV